MKAVILAAGEGSRLKPFTATRPKVMIPVGNKPILEYVINALQESGIVDIIMVVGYKREKIMDYFGDGHDWGVNITYVEQLQQLGTAHALRQSSHFLKDHFLVINGDTIIDSSAIKEIMRHRVGDAAMLTVNVENAQKYGVVKTQNGLVKSIEEKPKGEDVGNTVNAGVYRFSPRIFEFLEFMEISERGEYEITDAIKKMIFEEYPVKAVPSTATWLDALYPGDLIDMNTAVLRERKLRVKGHVEEGARIVGPVGIGENSLIMAGSYIVGPVCIGDNCDIGPNSVILPSTSIGSNCTIEPFTRISNSILMNNVKVSSFSYISRSILGEGTCVGPAFIAESDNTKIAVDERLVPANIGAIVGDDADIKGRVIVRPGNVIGARSRVGSGATVLANVPDNTRIL
ncbi:glucose-1-phosphate thymidylyltransferase [Methanocella sp. CWC-04]|uniref:Bifunctional protein GlmU n=1 Tax=Methanooceanicella nereidis TaxID=2052831 RepID=A0AAP2RCQ7_9EURY|nr:bifunctional sugar-1-phosphate nucleotidylyltransferase/acetyltransferase [Methanocella sp. CWC-04]MCD1294923.1 glucose-1-phosphate thymidylyltransferase [Methanocella sp. CWC-04]